MPVFLCKAVTRNPQTGMPIALPSGAIDRILINAPAGAVLQNVASFAISQGFGNRGVRYEIYPITPGGWEILAVQPYVGPQGISPQQPQISAQHVNGGQPTGMPVGQPGQNRPESKPDSAGFQVLGDDALSTEPDDSMFSDDSMAGTVSDLIGGGSQEIQRQF